jgi:hypothetical protein
VIVPADNDFKKRIEAQENQEVPESAVMEMKGIH